MPKPLVTGISPKEGYPGTKVIIRGENLGKDENDLIAVRICGVDCTLRAKWEKESRITTYTGLCIGKGDIVVITQSGGIGTSSVGFQGLVKKNIGPTDETCVWVDEDARSILTGLKRSVVNDLSLDNPLKISADDSRFEDLKSGLSHLKSNLGSKAANSTDNLLKTNISSFMDAIKIMKDIHNLSSIDKKNDFSKSLENMLNDILKTAHKIYDQDLASKDRADMIRNSLQILDTYKSLIYFPQNVDKYLKSEDYESIITSYKLANLQLSKAEPATRRSRLFEQIKADLDHKVVEVQRHLLDKLVQFPSSPDEQKLLIDYFNSLLTCGASSAILKNSQVVQISPGWYCLEEEKKWFVKLMIECRDMHIADEKVSLVLKQSSEPDSTMAVAAAAVKENGQTQKEGSDSLKIQAMTTIPHERNKFIEELCEMFFDIFTDYWRLGLMYCNNQLNLPLSANEKSKSAQHSADEFYALVADILKTFSDIVRAAFIPHTFKLQNSAADADNEKNTKSLLLAWPIKHDAKIISQILPHCLRVCRMCAMQIYSLEIPIQLFETIQNLIFDLRCECLIILMSTPTREILSTLGFEEEDWVVERDIDAENNSCLITHLPLRFEAKVTKALTLNKEFVLDDKKGEKTLFRESDFVNKVAILLYGILHALLKRISRFMAKEDEPPKFVHITRGKLLLYLFNNLTLCKRKILPDIWNMITQHKYKQIDQVIKESKKNVKDLQDSLLKQYMMETIGPIVDSIEASLYVGRYDFTDSSPPNAVRNYIKLIIMSLVSVHSELFIMNKSLILVVFMYAVKEIFSKLLSLFANVPQFGQQAAIQTYIDIFCLRETLKMYTSDESKEIIQQILKLIPSGSLENSRALITQTINEFLNTMQPYISIMQQQPPTSYATISFGSANSGVKASEKPKPAKNNKAKESDDTNL